MPGALQGIKVLELTRVAPGSLVGMMLADMGAEVIKIETPPAQASKGPVSTDDTAKIKEAVKSYLNRNKKSMAIDLKADEGRRLLQALAKEADVLTEGFRPGVMKRLGGDYDTLSAINPRIVYCSMSGFGSGGPYKDLAAHDLNYLSFGGALGLIGEAGRLPAIPLNIIADYAGASLHSVIGILLALMARQTTGRGQIVDITYLDGVVALTAAVPGVWQAILDGITPKRGTTAFGGQYPYYTCYETKDGKILSVGCLEQHFWEHLCKALGREDFIPYKWESAQLLEPANEAMQRVTAELRAIFKTKTRDEWFDFLVPHDVCIGKVLTLQEMEDDPQVRFRKMLVEVEHPVAGTVKQVGIPIKLSDTPGEIRSLAPYLGQDTEAIMKALGYSQDDVNRLRQGGVVA